MKKYWIIVALIFVNCLFDSCGILGPSPICFDVGFTGVDNFSYSNFQRLEAGDTTAVNQFVILLEGTNNMSTCAVGFSTGASLMAESPVYILLNNIVDLSIKSNAALNNDLPSGAELRDWFELVGIDKGCSLNQQAAIDCIDNFSDGWPDDDLKWVINDLATYGGLFDEDLSSTHLYGLDLTLDLVGEETSHVFTLRFEFENGVIQEFNSPPVLLKGL